jgi:endonuclease/exonuclease/phosphatase (EEP) superfamily protein YafD
MQFKPRTLRILVGLSLIALIQAGQSCTPLRAPEPPVQPFLRLMTYNLDKDAVDREAGVELIAQLDPDVVLFQEASADWQSLIRSRLAGRYPYISFNTPQSGYDGMGLISKYPVVDETWLPKANGGWFPAQLVRLQTPLGSLQVLNVHLRPPSSDTGNKLTGYFTTPGVRRQEVEALLGRLQPVLPTVVAGDFNEGDGGQAVGFVRHKGFTDALPEFDRKASTWQGVYKGLYLSERSDHVLYSPELRCFEARVIPEQASDHDPVLAVLGLKVR